MYEFNDLFLVLRPSARPAATSAPMTAPDTASATPPYQSWPSSTSVISVNQSLTINSEEYETIQVSPLSHILTVLFYWTSSMKMFFLQIFWKDLSSEQAISPSALCMQGGGALPYYVFCSRQNENNLLHFQNLSYIGIIT